MTPQQVMKLIRPLRDKVTLMLTRGLLASTDDSTDMQLVKVIVSDDVILDAVESLQPYGLSAHTPSDGGEVLIGCIGGDRDDAIAFRVGNSALRVKNLKTGEVCLYSRFGQIILLKEDGSIALTPKAGKSVDIASDLNVTGTITATVDVKAGNISAIGHTHDGTSIVPTVGGVVGTNAGMTGVPI